MSPAFLRLTLADADATAAVARRIALRLGPGDVLLLEGDIGAGKTTFARALIRARMGDPRLDVPSPTFTLVQTYDADGIEIWHCDLYRLTDPQELLELGLDDAFSDAVSLIEWPDRLGTDRPGDALLLRFAAGDDGHTLDAHGSAAWAARLGDLDG